MYHFSNLYGIPLLRKLSIRIYIHDKLEYRIRYMDYRKHCIETEFTTKVKKLDFGKLGSALTTAASLYHGHVRRCTVVIDDGKKEHVYKHKSAYIDEEIMKETLSTFSRNENDPNRVLGNLMKIQSGDTALANVLAIGLIFGVTNN